MLVVLAFAVALAAAGCGGGANEATSDPGSTTRAEVSSSAPIPPSTSVPSMSPRFSDAFTCAYGFEPDDGGENPLLSGPSFCDDPVLRARLDGGGPWFPDPGNGRACLGVEDMLEAGPALGISCYDAPAVDEADEFCDTMKSLEPEVAASDPDASVVGDRLRRAVERLSPGDARDWTEKLLDIWSRPIVVDSVTALLNVNGFTYAEITCGFSFERIGEPPSQPLPSVPEPTVAPPMEVDDEPPAAGSWIAMLASVPIEQHADAIDMAAEWMSQGLDPVLIDSRDFDGLNDPFWVLALAGFASKTEAQDACAEILGSPAFGFVPDCLVRQL